jgi:hypothetical protein
LVKDINHENAIGSAIYQYLMALQQARGSQRDTSFDLAPHNVNRGSNLLAVHMKGVPIEEYEKCLPMWIDCLYIKKCHYEVKGE